MDESVPGPLARLVATPRRRVLLAAAVVLLVLRMALPAVLRPILLARADEALVGFVELEDLDLALLAGGVTLHGLAVHVDEAPGQAPVLLEARRLSAEIGWLALVTRTIEIEDFELEGFRVHLERDADGLRLPSLVPSAEEAAEEEPEEAAARPWSFAADAVSFRDGRIEFVDHTVRGEPEKVDLAIEDLTARELAVRSEPGDDEPGRIAIDAKLDQGSVSLAAWLESYADGLDIRSTLVLDDIPIDKARAYLTDLGWSGLTGLLDAELEHHFESGGVHELKGKVALARLQIGVPKQVGPVLAWEKLEVVLDRIDLVKRHAELASISALGPRVVVDPRADQPLALLAARAPALAEPVEPAEPAAAPAWTWRVSKLAIDDATIDLRGGPEPLPLTLTAALESLSSEPESRAPIALAVANGPGQLRLAGELSPSPIAFDGRLTIESLALAPLLAQIDAPAVHWLTSGTLRADVVVGLARDLRAKGSLGLAGLDLEEETTAKQFGVEWKDLAVGLESLTVRNLLSDAESENGIAPQRALDVRVARLGLVEPRLVLSRGTTGLVLPPLRPGKAESRATGDAETTVPSPSGEAATPTTSPGEAAPDEPSPESEASSPGLPITLAIAETRIEGGRLKLADRAVEPFYRGRIEDLVVDAKGLRWPRTEVDSLALSATGLKGARLSLAGSIHPDKSKLEGELVALPLAQFNPYLASSGYDLRQGDLSLESRVRLAPERVKTKSRIVLAGLDVGGSEGRKAFQESFGLPLEVALGLLEDLDGRITLAVPVAGKPEKMKVGIGRVVAQALRKALVGALASPLKLLGAGARKGEQTDLTPAPVAFRAGETGLAPESAERVEEIAALLAASPGIALRLTGQTDAADERLLCERALLQQLEAGRGVRALASLGEIATRRAVREHLARKLAGKPAPALAPAEARWLESHLATARPSTELLESVARGRAEALRAALVEEHGVVASRLAIDPPRTSPPAPMPGVAIALGLTSAKTDDADDADAARPTESARADEAPRAD